MPSFIQYTALQGYALAELGIKEAHTHGFSHWYIDLSLQSDTPDQWTIERIKNMQAVIQQYQIFPIMHGNYKLPLASDINVLRQAAIEYTKSEIRLAQKMQAPLIIHGGAIVEPRLVKWVKKQALDGFLESVKVLVDYAQSLGVTLWVENLSNYKNNHPFYYIFTMSEEFEYILDRVPEVKFFLDIGHANIGNQNIKQIIQTFHKRIIGVSISNNDGVRDQHRSLLNGTVNFSDIIQLFSHCQWSGYVGVEVRDMSPANVLMQLSELHNAVSIE
ncbi:MAG: hypothetical protein A3F17_01140 [Gammaproteobacteria bacterium RIFCSPHIGHO2_12_FULL_41_15]|nr:MAG: hypothetical protein A3F17_01140 [Gammaproteobacteria bacterium RIFCSPHIGHO2_12_FULL_41_15]